jgi:hypothetical protein
MKKIPTLFKREFTADRTVLISNEITSGLEEVLKNGIATEKIDGACCAVIDGVFYKRFDAKKGRNIPANAIKCDEPDAVTGHFPHWVPVDVTASTDRWFVAAYMNYAKQIQVRGAIQDATYEAIGPHFRSNPYNLKEDILVKHGIKEIELTDRTFEGVKNYLRDHYIEGIVFWYNGEPRCKIKRSDFGYEWNKSTKKIKDN